MTEMQRPSVEYKKHFNVRVMVRCVLEVTYLSGYFEPRTSMGLIPLNLVKRDRDDNIYSDTYVCTGISPSLFLVGLASVDGMILEPVKPRAVTVGTFAVLDAGFIEIEHAGSVWKYKVTFTVVPANNLMLVEYAQHALPEMREAVFAEQIDKGCYKWLKYLSEVIDDKEKFSEVTFNLLSDRMADETLQELSGLNMRWDVYYKRFDYNQLLKNRLS